MYFAENGIFRWNNEADLLPNLVPKGDRGFIPVIPN